MVPVVASLTRAREIDTFASMKRHLLGAALVSFLVGTFGCSGNSNPPPMDAAPQTDVAVLVDAGTVDASRQLDASVVDATTAPDVAIDVRDPDACVPHTYSFADGGVMLTPSRYRQFPDSPFYCRPFTSFVLANFEGDAGVPNGVTSQFGMPYPAAGHAGNTDSVDGDDGIPNGGRDGGTGHPCEGCRSFFSNPGSVGVDFRFGAADASLPTHVGLVWTDGNGPTAVTFTAYAADGGVIANQVTPGIGDGSNAGETDEDRFFGIVAPQGVSRITMTHTSGGMEIDHLQFGR